MTTRNGAIEWRESMLALPLVLAGTTGSEANEIRAHRAASDRRMRGELKALQALPVDASDSDVRAAVAS